MELQLADLSQLQKQHEKVSQYCLSEEQLLSKSKSGQTTQIKNMLSVVDRCISSIEQDRSPATIEWSKEELVLFKSLQLLTSIPPLYILNTSLDHAVSGNKYTDQVVKYLGDSNYIILSAQLEQESTLFDDSNSQREYLAQYGIKESALNRVVSSCSKLLGLNTFYTVGKNEARAWHTERGATVSEAGARIHSDFQKKFVKAEVMHFNDYTELGT